MEEEATVLVCLLVEEGLKNPSAVVKGSIEGLCSKCLYPVYISKSGQKLLEQKNNDGKVDGVNIICMECVKEILAKEDCKVSVVPGAHQEILNNR